MSIAAPLCVDCRHYKHGAKGPLQYLHLCEHPSAIVESRDPVTGFVVKTTLDCNFQRGLGSNAQCGPEGKYFELADEPRGVGFIE